MKCTGSALEAFASQTLLEAQQQASEYYDAKKKALEELLESTRQKAESLRMVQSEGADATT